MVNLQRLIIWFIVIALILPVYADSGSNAYKHGVQAERQSKFDDAYTYYKQALASAPKNPTYIAAYTRIRFAAAADHVHRGQTLRNTGALSDALVEFQRAVSIDTSNFVAQQEMRRTVDSIRKQERQKEGPKTEPPVNGLDSVADTLELRT